ncbi:MAG TPA: hypothetical protein VKB58_04225 [Terriglobales bacterium]|nr:hypothetical protein [Terriglobales bacterium]
MSKTSKIIQIVIVVAIVAAAINLYLTFRQRHTGVAVAKQPEVALDPDYYVTPRKLHPQDLKDAKELTKQPVWVRDGYRYTFYPYNGHSDFQHAAGTLGPIQKLEIKDVVVDRTPDSSAQKQVMAVFEQDGKRYAFPIGIEEHGDYKIYSDEILFIQDPHELYKHWPADVWNAIDKHEVKPGMNELQAFFAIGMGSPEGTGMSNPRVVDFPNNGHPVRVTFTNGKATDVQPS